MMRAKSELRPYQDATATALYDHHGIIAVLPMGTGKTASALTAVADLIQGGHIRHGLITAPKRVVNLVWPQEIAAWTHTAGLKFDVLNGDPESRSMLLGQAPFRDLTIIGIDHLQWLCGELAKLPDEHPLFDLLVVDEISKFKSPKSKRARAVLALSGRFRTIWGLTGTPRPNGYEDLFKPLELISRGQLWGRSFYAWQKQRFYPLDRNGYEWRILPQWEQPTLAEAAAWMFTLAEEDMPELPPVTILEDEVELPPAAREAYNDMQKKLLADVGDDPRRILAFSAGVAAGKLAQMANGHIYGEGGNADVERLHDAKEDWLVDLVDGLQGEPLIVVYEFVEDLRRIHDLFGPVPYLGQGVSDRIAAAHVEAWNAGTLPLFAIHAASGGHGLNLQFGGRRMAWYGLTWSAELWDQTCARIARPGQARPVFIHVCLARHTVDELKRLRVLHKLEAQEAFRLWLKTV